MTHFSQRVLAIFLSVTHFSISVTHFSNCDTGRLSHLPTCDPFIQVCMTDDFFICSIKSPQCTGKYSIKFFFDSDFPSTCVDVPKASNLTSGGRPKTGDWGRV